MSTARYGAPVFVSFRFRLITLTGAPVPLEWTAHCFAVAPSDASRSAALLVHAFREE